MTPCNTVTFYMKGMDYMYSPCQSVAYRVGGFGVFKPPPRNSEDIGGVLDRVSKKSRRLDFLM